MHYQMSETQYDLEIMLLRMNQSKFVHSDVYGGSMNSLQETSSDY